MQLEIPSPDRDDLPGRTGDETLLRHLLGLVDYTPGRTPISGIRPDNLRQWTAGNATLARLGLPGRPFSTRAVFDPRPVVGAVDMPQLLPARSLSPVTVTVTVAVIVAVAIVGWLETAGLASEPRPDAEIRLATQLRRPVALLRLDDTLLSANRESGTITEIDPHGGKVVAEHRVAQRIADMSVLDGERTVLVLDDARGELRGVAFRGDPIAVHSIARLADGAARLAVSVERRRVFVSHTWSRRVLVVDLDEDRERATRRDWIDLPFAPRELLLVRGNRYLIAADAFGGHLAVIDARRSRHNAVHEIHGHNLRGLATSNDGELLHVAHQQMTPRALADYEELHWGRMVKNAVQVFDLDELLEDAPGRSPRGWLNVQGGIGGAAGDPADVVVSPHGLTAVSIGGATEVALHARGSTRRVSLQRQPGALAIDGERLYVAHPFDDAVSIVDLRPGEVAATISLGPAPDLTAAQRGERLFFDARLSHDAWISCHSCHTDGHSSGLLVDTLGDGDYGAPKRVPSLLGTGDTGSWGWVASSQLLEEQVQKSVTTTMHGQDLEPRQLADLVAFLQSLEPPPPLRTEDDRLLERGRELFTALDCADCHTPPAFTSDATYSVGLRDEKGRRSFNPPSLRGVGHRPSLFHDGRADGLEEVLGKYQHQLDEPLSKSQRSALIAYLQSL